MLATLHKSFNLLAACALLIGGGYFEVAHTTQEYTAQSPYSHLLQAESLDAVIPYLDTSDPLQARIAVWRIGKMDDERVEGLLLDLWNRGKASDAPGGDQVLSHPSVRLMVADSLIELQVGDQPAYVRYIESQLEGGDSGSRSYAANALGSIADDASVTRLASLTQEDDIGIALNAVAGLQRVASKERAPGRRSALEALRSLYENRELLPPIVAKQLEPVPVSEENGAGRPAQQSEASAATDFERGERLHMSGREHAKALQLLMPYAMNGHARAQYYVGQLYLSGIGIRHDVDKAVEWFSRSAEQGDGAAQIALAMLYLSGEGVERSEQRAVELVRAAAVQGNREAQELLATAYERGWWGLDQDPMQSRYWRNKAESQLGDKR